ncbi:MAG TPA: MFS transporter [Dehalococcoidia bacterium]|jgi:MFS family permease|nr:MFS transporter [Dehalococcoidia bacterium]
MTENAAPTSASELAPDQLARRRRMLAVVALATLGALTVWFSTNAISAALGEQFGFGDGELAWLTIAVQFGFVAGTLLSALGNLTECMNARPLFALAALLAALANLAPVPSGSFAVWLLARFATGVFLGGVYPPAIHVVSGWYCSGRGLALGVVIGALTLGSRSRHLLRVLLEGQWELTMLLASALAALVGLAMWLAVEDGPFHSTPQQVRLVRFWRGVSARAAARSRCRQRRELRCPRDRSRILRRRGSVGGSLRAHARHLGGDDRQRQRGARDRVHTRLAGARRGAGGGLGLDGGRRLGAVLRRDDRTRR